MNDTFNGWYHILYILSIREWDCSKSHSWLIEEILNKKVSLVRSGSLQSGRCLINSYFFFGIHLVILEHISAGFDLCCNHLDTMRKVCDFIISAEQLFTSWQHFLSVICWVQQIGLTWVAVLSVFLWGFTIWERNQDILLEIGIS